MRWKCIDGSVKEINELSDNHLNNAIKYCKKNDDQNSLKELEKEFKRREHIKSAQPCPWCGTIMRIKY